MTVRIEIDPNVRVRGNQTFTGLGDIHPPGAPVAIGDDVIAFESEAGIAGPARVTDVDREKELIFLAVDWASMREDRPGLPAVRASLRR